MAFSYIEKLWRKMGINTFFSNLWLHATTKHPAPKFCVKFGTLFAFMNCDVKKLRSPFDPNKEQVAR